MATKIITSKHQNAINRDDLIKKLENNLSQLEKENLDYYEKNMITIVKKQLKILKSENWRQGLNFYRVYVKDNKLKDYIIKTYYVVNSIIEY